MSRYRRSTNIPKKGVIACIYLLLAVVVLVCYIYLHGGTKPGVYYSCDEKIPATVRLMDNMEFIEVNGWKPLILPDTSVYIISADDSACTIVYEGSDEQHTSYAMNVPLSDLEYDKAKLSNVQKIHNCRVGYLPDNSDSAVTMAVRIIMYTIIAVLLISMVVFVVVNVKGL